MNTACKVLKCCPIELIWYISKLIILWLKSDLSRVTLYWYAALLEIWGNPRKGHMQVTQCHDLRHQIKMALAILWKCYLLPNSCATVTGNWLTEKHHSPYLPNHYILITKCPSFVTLNGVSSDFLCHDISVRGSNRDILIR